MTTKSLEVLRFSANLGFLWPDRPLLGRIDAAAQAGFRAIELHFPYAVPAADIAAAVQRNGLTLLGINTPPGAIELGELGLAALPGRETEFQQGLDCAIEYARGAGACFIHVLAGNVDAAGRPAAREVFARNLAMAARKADAHRLTLLLEPLNRQDHPRYFYSTLAEAASLIEELRIPNLKLELDVYHVARGEGDVLTKIERYLPLTSHVQIAAVPSRAEPDEGEIDCREVFAALAQLGYRGWIGCEYRPRGDTDAGLKWLSRLTDSRR